VPEIGAHADQTDRGGEPGWTLTDAHVPDPTRLRGGGMLTIARQQGGAWLGARTADAHAEDTGIALSEKGHTTRIDQAAVKAESHGGPVSLSATLEGIHPGTDEPGAGALLPSAVFVQGHTTPAGATALAALLDHREAAGPAPISVDEARFLIGPAEFQAHGMVTLSGANDRHGELIVTARHFGDLLRSLPTEGPALRAYPVLMVLRQFGQKDGDTMRWTVDFDGPKVLVDGLDVAALAAL
jgi:hypothetical protein